MIGLFGSTVLEAAIGAASVYLLLAVFCSAVNEWIAHALDVRAGNLRASLAALLANQSLPDGSDFLQAFCQHPVISGVSSYLPPRAFSAALIDLATAHVQGTVAFRDLEEGLCNLPEGPVRRALLALIQNAQGDLLTAEANLEHWFNDAMDRASLWYKRRAQIWTLALAVIVTLATNADTLQILHRFWLDPGLRTAAPSSLLGWTSQSLPKGPLDWLSRIMGWALTATAVSLGAPFWFDVLNRTTRLRNVRNRRTRSIPVQ